MSDMIEKLKGLLQAYGDRKSKTHPKPLSFEAERQRRACGDILRTVVRPVLEACMNELKAAGHEASTRDHTDRQGVDLQVRPTPWDRGDPGREARPDQGPFAVGRGPSRQHGDGRGVACVGGDQDVEFY